MSYSNNPNLPRARALGLRLLINEGLPLQVVANKCGVHRSTIYRWKLKWLEINQNVQLENVNRPSRDAGKNTFRLAALKWLIPTLSSKPKVSPTAIRESVVERILELRRLLKRCAEIIWHHLTHEDGIRVSLSSVRRILRRHHYVKGRKPRVRRDNPIRPTVTKPGELIQADTIHYVCPFTKRRRYVYTLIDLHTRMAYAEIHSAIRPGIAATVVLKAESMFGFRFSMVQTDNGPEYGRYFEDTLRRAGILVRHSRLHRPNDNAHIERFNRTIQDECLGRCLTYRDTTQHIQSKLTTYLEFYNVHRVHLSLQYRTPAEMLQSS
jgi:transposase InsO family protein